LAAMHVSALPAHFFDDRRGAFVFRTEPWAAVLRFPYGDGTVAVAGLEYELSVIFASTAVTT